MSERQWTPQQRQCLEARGTVLVSAAAGSGKTAVLVERAIRLLTDPQNPIDVDELLVVTFSRPAAAEMKRRLSDALARALKERPGDARLRRQLMLLPGASICTVHSFCGDLVREHFHLLPDVPPNFKIAENDKTAPLRAEAMEELMEARYAAHDPAFTALVELLGGARDDRQLSRRVARLYDFVQASPDPARWLEEHAAPYRTPRPPAQTPCGQELLQTLAESLEQCGQLYAQAVTWAESDEGLTGCLPLLREERALTAQLAQTAQAGDWDKLRRALNELCFARFSGAKRTADPAVKERVLSLRNRAKKRLGSLDRLLTCDEAQAAADARALCPLVEELFSLVSDFSKRYTDKKRQRSLLDFNDLEHLALSLLTAPDGDGALLPTPLAREVAARYAYVMVDEYQDTNQAQEEIFRAVSREESNLFFVGDVKQSIYAFRSATPTLFLARRDRYPDYDGEHYPAAIRLGHNFRSRPSVTGTVNFLFSQLMTRETCGVDYAAGEALVPAAAYPPLEEDAAELLLVEESGRAGEVQEAEAGALAARIEEMLAREQVSDGEGLRPLRPGDICVLMRSVKDRAAAYADALTRRGIPVLSGGGGGFFDTPEIAFVLSLLRFLDNPLQDVPLLAVLLSPVFGFTPDEAAQLRAADRRCPLFVALRRRARGEDALGRRFGAFLARTDQWRTLAAVTPADRLLARLYEELSLPAVMGARRQGARRVANLHQLLDTARRFEQNGFRGLGAFLRYLEGQRKLDETAPAQPAGDEDAVRILTIHASKGLEFPVVFLAGLSRQFNNQSTHDALLLHRELGVGMNLLDMDTLELHETLPHRALTLRILRDERAEDLRVLYVAATRARERLCLVVSGDIPALCARAADACGPNGTLPAPAVREAAGFADWVMMALLRHPDAAKLREWGGFDGETLPCEAALRIRRVTAPPAAAGTEMPAPQKLPPPVPQNLAALRERLAFQYPFAPLSGVPVKAAASELAHQPLRERYAVTARPAFFSESALSPAERGTALHQFMQYADYAAAAADLPAEVQRLVKAGFLTSQQGACLPLPRLTAFFQSDLYVRIRRSPRVLREYAFAVERPAALCAPQLPADLLDGEQVLIQGIADCVFEEDGRLIIVDYKTDRVKTAGELAERYRLQLELYTQALQVQLDMPVGERLLYSFALQCPVAV